MAFFKIHFICFEMHMDRPDKSENMFGFLKKAIVKKNPYFCNPLIK